MLKVKLISRYAADIDICCFLKVDLECLFVFQVSY